MERANARIRALYRIAGPVCCAMVAGWSSLAAQPVCAQRGTVGAAVDALPGIERVGAAAAPEARWTLAGGADYGYTGDVLGQDDSHSSVGLDIAASMRPLDILAVSLQSRGRFDLHSNVGDEEVGLSAHTRAKLRAGPFLDHDVKLAFEAGLTLPATDDAGAALSALTPELALLLTTHASARLSLMVQLGFRLDRQAEAIDGVRSLSVADRVTLGVGEANVVPVGLGASYRVSALELLGEWSWDVRVGEHAPEPLESSMWLRAGVRAPLLPGTALTVLLGLNLASRPDVVFGEPVQEIPPRLWLGVRISSDALAPARAGVDVDGAAGVTGAVRDAAGAPLAGVELVAGAVRTRSAADGSFTLEGLPAGSAEVVATLDGYDEVKTAVSVDADGRSAAPLQIALAAAPVDWSTVVRGPDGQPLSEARVTLTRGEQPLEGVTDAEGRAAIKAVPAGSYTLRIEKDGFVAVERELSVGPGAAPSPPAVQLEAALPEGQIRGTVRSFNGKPLRARARVVSLGVEARANEHGEFTIDVPPGRYQVVVTAPGHRKQTRSAHVEDHGVTVLIVDLRRSK